MRKPWLSMCVATAVILLLSGCHAPAAASAPPRLAVSTPEVVPPDQVASRFYQWYLDGRGRDGLPNRLADHSYRFSEYLVPEAIEKVDRVIAGFGAGGYDPFLCAQDVPASLTYRRPVVTGDRATVLVQTSFVGHSFRLAFRRVAELWRIEDIRCGQAGTAE